MDIIAGVIGTLSILASIKLSGKWFDKRRFAEFGFRFNKTWMSQFAFGFALGMSLIILIFAVDAAFGYVTIHGYLVVRDAELPVGLAFSYAVIKAMCVGTYEEAISRGYQVTNLREGFAGLWNLGGPQTILPAIVLSSCAFGALHLVNTGVTLLGAINIAVVGILYATAFVVTRQLGMSIGLHMAWNLTQGLLLGFPSGDSNEPASVINITVSGPSWITGGSSGPEAGLLAPLAALIGTAFY